MRDGQYVGTWPVVNKETGEKLTNDFIIKQMVGREMTNQFPPREGRPSDEVVLKVEHVCSPLKKSFQDVSFELHKQEILGIGGLVGAQRTEFVEALFGLRGIESGEIYLNGAKYTAKSPGPAGLHCSLKRDARPVYLEFCRFLRIQLSRIRKIMLV